jgi:uroporphyrinogen III methyltransferase/synthase
MAETHGKVYLVGAGPGDPELLTLKGQRILAGADVVIHDRLVSPRLLRHCRPGAEIIDAGKRGPRPSVRQEEINALLVRHAAAGRHVCRLKGGDPFLFGRGGEEAEALLAAGIPFEVVPGVTSAMAVPAYAGIPVTHRGMASSVAILTGHAAEGGVASPSWDLLAAAAETVLVLMGVENLTEVITRFVTAGRPPETPAAVIQWGTTRRQRSVTGTLSSIEDQVRRGALGPPAVLVVGNVVSLGERLRWFDNRPLFGKTVLVTRAREQAGALSALIEERGGEAVEFPVIRIEALPDVDLSALEVPFDWILFTSVNDVHRFFEALDRGGRDARSLGGARLGVVGSATAAALREWRLRADFVPSAFVAERLAAELPLVRRSEPLPGGTATLATPAVFAGTSTPAPGSYMLDQRGSTQSRGASSPTRILIPRALEAPSLLPEGLRARGASVDVISVYRTVKDGADADMVRRRLSAGDLDAITFTASSTVRNFRELLPDAPIGNARIVCIGPVTAETARQCNFRVDAVAEEHTIPGLVRALEHTLG